MLAHQVYETFEGTYVLTQLCGNVGFRCVREGCSTGGKEATLADSSDLWQRCFCPNWKEKLVVTTVDLDCGKNLLQFSSIQLSTRGHKRRRLFFLSLSPDRFITELGANQ